MLSKPPVTKVIAARNRLSMKLEAKMTRCTSVLPAFRLKMSRAATGRLKAR